MSLTNKQTYDSLKLFLSKVYSLMSQQLIQNCKSTALEGWNVQWADPIKQIDLVQTLSNSSQDSAFAVRSVAWNNSGGMIYIGMGLMDYKPSSYTPALLCVWNIALKRHLDPRKPTLTIELPTSIQSLAAHPQLPALLVVGTYSGDIFCIDASRDDDPIVAQSKMGQSMHWESVSKVLWIPGVKRDTFDALSVSADGKILRWDLTNNFAFPVASIQLNLAHLPKMKHLIHDKNKEIFGESKVSLPVGATALSLLLHSQKDVIVGTEAGNILHCLLENELTSKLSPTNVEVNVTPDKFNINPIQMNFSAMIGPVQAVACSLFHRNLFLACGYDGIARLFSRLESRPLVEINLNIEENQTILYDVAWSPTRPCVWAVCGSEGKIWIFDLYVSSSKAVALLSIPSTTNERLSTNVRQDLTSLSFSSSHLASGSSSGTSYIWKLSSNLIECNPIECQWLEKWVRNAEGGSVAFENIDKNTYDNLSSKDHLDENDNSNTDLNIATNKLPGGFNSSNQNQKLELIDSVATTQKPTRWSSAQSSILGSGVDLLIEKYATHENKESNQYDNQEFEDE